jgi:hypothetical protein
MSSFVLPCLFLAVVVTVRCLLARRSVWPFFIFFAGLDCKKVADRVEWCTDNMIYVAPWFIFL